MESDIRKIIHIDMDAFFAAIEQRENPELRGKPVIVGGDPAARGVVSTCSYEARAFGVRSAMPARTALRLCPEAIIVRPRMALYRQVSQEIMRILRSHTDLVEPLALDEAFLDVTVNRRGEPLATAEARAIKQQIYQATGLTASAGVSFNKLLAKIASGYRKPDGLTVVPPQRAVAFLDPLPVRKFFGVGPISERRLREAGVLTGADLRAMSEEQLVAMFKERGKQLYQFARAIDRRPVNPSRERKSLGKEITLPADVADRGELGRILDQLAENLAAASERQGAPGLTLCLKVRLSDFRTLTRRISAREPFREAAVIAAHARRLLEQIDLAGGGVRTIGLSLHKLGQTPAGGPPTEAETLSMF